jgi:hypothetical protein
MGYYGLFLGLEYRNDRVMVQKLDADEYNAHETVTLKIPIAVPYVFDSPSFERVHGEFQYKGEFYRLVKQRLSKDTLHVVCVKDVQSKHLQRALTSYVETFTDKPASSTTGSNVFSNFSKDYFSPIFLLDQLSLGWSADVTQRTSPLTINSTFCSSVVHPPERSFSL